MSVDMREVNTAVIAEYRANAGRLSGLMEGQPVLLLTTTGRRTGRPHTTPLGYTVQDGRLVVAASNGGAPTDPHWYGNLVAAPQVGVELLAERFDATAVVLEGDERDEMFAHHACVLPGVADYARVAGRVIPLVALHRHPEERNRRD
jgi:deazaflavin-dependent oxidoreductase (nitroreductase family)